MDLMDDDWAYGYGIGFKNWLIWIFGSTMWIGFFGYGKNEFWIWFMD